MTNEAQAQKFNSAGGFDSLITEHEVLEIDDEGKIVNEGSEEDEWERYYGKMRIEHPRVEPIVVNRRWDVDTENQKVHEYTRYYEADATDAHLDVIHDADAEWGYKDEPNFEASLTADPQAELELLLNQVSPHTYDRLTKTIEERVDELPRNTSVEHTRNDTWDLDESDRFETVVHDGGGNAMAGFQIWVDKNPSTRHNGGYVADLRDHGEVFFAEDSLQLAHELSFHFEEPIIISSEDEKTTGVTPSGLVVYNGGEVDEEYGGEHLLEDFKGEGMVIDFHQGKPKHIDDVRDFIDMERVSE
jgi:hypothetical protein